MRLYRVAIRPGYGPILVTRKDLIELPLDDLNVRLMGWVGHPSPRIATVAKTFIQACPKRGNDICRLMMAKPLCTGYSSSEYGYFLRWRINNDPTFKIPLYMQEEIPLPIRDKVVNWLEEAQNRLLNQSLAASRA